MSLNFKIEKKLDGCLGRAGILETPNGVIKTPAFVVVSTKATVKALTPEQVKDLGAQAVLANTYHLYLQPGLETIKKAGGFGKFMNWSGPTMTDSGGFQVFSLGEAFGRKKSKVSQAAENSPAPKHALEFPSGNSLLFSPSLAEPPARHRPARAPKGFVTGEFSASHGELETEEPIVKLAEIDEEGVTFKSVIDGSSHRFTPERSMEIQAGLGADIIFAFDECTAPDASHEYQREAMERTHRWAKRSLTRKFFGGFASQALFGIVQGGRHKDLREESAKAIGKMDFDGFGIGGSFDKEDMYTVVEWVNKILPEEKPRHLLGIGEPEDLFGGIENGCDLFDCVAPTRNARNGTLYTKHGKINILNAKYRNDFSPIEGDCDCYACKNYTKAYLAHLFRAKEILASTLASIHNLYFIVNLVKKIRQSILNGNFLEFKEEFLRPYSR